MENSVLIVPVDDEYTLWQLQGASIGYQIAIGGQRVSVTQHG
ncbi:hypothetical protein [Glaciecola sp. 33A]|jgi:hypothetical protein|nr:hypothetical protein [Glaciecola sp. 33A]